VIEVGAAEVEDEGTVQDAHFDHPQLIVKPGHSRNIAAANAGHGMLSEA
jgi:hypothetical protein